MKNGERRTEKLVEIKRSGKYPSCLRKEREEEERKTEKKKKRKKEKEKERKKEKEERKKERKKKEKERKRKKKKEKEIKDLREKKMRKENCLPLFIISLPTFFASCLQNSSKPIL